MNTLSPRQIIEHFHLLFLQHLGRVMDRNLYVLKGGCNLRFFLRSIRYSEDIDMDVHTVAPMTLQKNVDKVLSAPALAKSLQVHGISIERYSSPKQTNITQRWKVALKLKGRELSLPTKIEFSRRKNDFSGEVEFSSVQSEILNLYELFPISLNHYTLEASISQKISALANRPEIQCRDIFDLYFLFQKQYKIHALKVTKPDLLRAKDHCLAISYPEYKAQVVAYLMPEYEQEYHSITCWEAIRERVKSILSEL